MKNNDPRITSFDEREKTCCFTGHRSLTAAEKGRAAARIKQAVRALAAVGVTNFITGGALGFDTAAAVTVINLKRSEYPQIKILVAVPFRAQAARWKYADRALYNTVLEAADEVVYLFDEYNGNCMGERNRFMVDNSLYCLSYVTKNFGGSYSTERYALSKGLKVLNLADVNWE